MTPSPDASAAILTDRIRRGLPTVYVRFGDGAVECIRGSKSTATCDGEEYTPALAKALHRAICLLLSDYKQSEEGVFFGDWRTAVAGSAPQRVEEWEDLMCPRDRYLLDFEALLPMRNTPALVDFYRAIREDKRRKAFMGPEWAAPAARFLQADHIIVPMYNLFSILPAVEKRIAAAEPEILLWGAGMAGVIAAVHYWQRRPRCTFIHLGSALDPLSGRRTRRNQASLARLRVIFDGLL